MYKKIAFTVFILLISNTSFASILIQHDRPIPYIRQIDFAEFGWSACLPSSLSMILNYHFPNAHVSAGQVYHSGTQQYDYKGPLEYYRNVGYMEIGPSYGIADTGLSEIPIDQHTNYSGGNGQAIPLNYTTYLKKYWGANIKKISATRESILNALESGPLLASVECCGWPKAGHYLVIRNIDDNGTTVPTSENPTPTDDDLVILNDPYPCHRYKDNEGNIKRTGEEGKVLLSTFLGQIRWGIFEITFPSFEDIEKQYTVLVDTAHSVNDGYYNNGESPIAKYTIYDYENIATDNLSNDNVYRENMFHKLEIEDESMEDIMYDLINGKDIIYLNPDNTNNNENISSVKYKPHLSMSGIYEINYIFYDCGNIADVEFKIKKTDGTLVDNKFVSYKNTKKIENKRLWSSAYLENGYYIEANNIPKDINIDAMQFIFVESLSLNKTWFFNSGNSEGWANKTGEALAPNDKGWLQLDSSPDAQIMSPYLSFTPSEVDYIQFYIRNDGDNEIGNLCIWTDLNGGYDTETVKKEFELKGDNRWHLVQIKTDAINGWNSANLIHGIQINPVVNGSGQNNRIYIDYIKLRKQETNQAAENILQHPDGALITTSIAPYDPDTQNIYFIENGKKRFIPSKEIFMHFNFDLCNVITVSTDELDCYDEGDQVTIGTDEVIKIAGTAPAYVQTEPNRVRWIQSEEVFHDSGFSSSQITYVDEINYEHSADINFIYPDGTLLKFDSSSGVYMISNGMLSLITDVSIFSALGYSTKDSDQDGLWDSIIEIKAVPYGKTGKNISNDIIEKCSNPANLEIGLEWPLGGESLIGGVKRLIKYYINLPDLLISPSSVMIGYTTDAFKNFIKITDFGSNHSEFWWDVPDVDSDKVLVEIVAYDKDGRPYSAVPSTYLSIQKNGTTGQDYFDIFNDGGTELKITNISLENTSQWVSLTQPSPEPSPLTPLVINANDSVRIPVSVSKTGLSHGTHTDVIIIESEGLPDETVEIELLVKTENSAPDAPVLSATPSDWLSSQTYSINWPGSSDPSGIVGGYYKIGSAPVNNTDGTYFDISEKPLQIPVFADGAYTVYVWLQDNLSNIDFTKNDSVLLKHDSTPPQIQQTSPSMSSINIPVHTSISCFVSDQYADIDTSDIIMMVNGFSVLPQQIENLNGGVWIEYQPPSNFNFDETVMVYLKISDNSSPIANFIEKTYSFQTFSAGGDADADNLSNSDEYINGTNPLNSDSDFDGMADGWEVDNGLEPSSGEGINGPDGDIDGDGLTNILEYLDGLYYMADPVTIVDAPVGTVTENSFTIHIAGDGVVAYKYKFNDDSWQPETTVDIPIELVDLPDGMCSISVIGMDQNGYWQSTGSVTLASWVVEAAPSRYSLSNGYIYLSGTDGYLDELKVDPAGAGNYGQNIINANGRIDWLINGSTFSNINTTIQIQEQNRIVLNNQAGALWDINLNGAQFTSSLNIAYAPTNVQVSVDMPYEDSGYFDYAQRYHWEYNNNHDATDIPFKTFYSQTGNTRTIEYFMRNNDDGNYMQFRTNLWDDTQGEPASGNNRLIAIGTGIFDIDFNNLPSHRIWMDKTSDTLTLCSGQDTNVQTINFDFEVTQFDENEGIDVNENGDKMPYFYTSDNEAITNAYGGEYTFDELLNRFYRQSAFYYTDVGLNIWWNWASQYTGFVNNWYRNKLKANLETWEQGDDGYGHSGYMWSWPGNREWPMGNLYLTYDFRFLNTNALFIQAVWNYYAWTGDDAFLGGQLQRLRDAMQYQLDWLGGGSEQIINGDNNYDSDHGGIHNEDVGTNYWDIMPFGGKDAYCSIDFYKSLEALARIEYTLGNTTEGDSYTTMAEQAKTAYNATFWSTTTNRYIGAIDRLDNIHDYGFSFVNIEALAAGLGDPSKVDQIYNWLDSGDIYDKWNFAPRTNVETTQNLWRIPNNNGYVWEQQLQDGGANLYVSGYDVIARAKYINADDAYDRLKAVLARYSEPDKLTGGSPTIFNETIQGGSDGAGSLGVMSHEFPESGIAGSSFLYAFIGLSPQWDGLHIDPKLPSGQAYIGAKNINYHGMNLNVHIEPGLITIACTKNEDIGDSYYVVNGSRELFPTGPFTIEIYNSDLNNDGDVDGRDIAELCEQIELGLIANPQNAISSFANRFGWLK